MFSFETLAGPHRCGGDGSRVHGTRRHPLTVWGDDESLRAVVMLSCRGAEQCWTDDQFCSRTNDNAVRELTLFTFYRDYTAMGE